MSDLASIQRTALDAVTAAPDIMALDTVRVRYLGKKGELTGLLKNLGTLPADERPAAGAKINTVKRALQQAILEKRETLEQAAIDATLNAEALDVTVPGRK